VPEWRGRTADAQQTVAADLDRFVETDVVTIASATVEEWMWRCRLAIIGR